MFKNSVCSKTLILFYRNQKSVLNQYLIDELPPEEIAAGDLAVTSKVVLWHFLMMNDTIRNDAYEKSHKPSPQNAVLLVKEFITSRVFSKKSPDLISHSQIIKIFKFKFESLVIFFYL